MAEKPIKALDHLEAPDRFKSSDRVAGCLPQYLALAQAALLAQ